MGKMSKFKVGDKVFLLDMERDLQYPYGLIITQITKKGNVIMSYGLDKVEARMPEICRYPNED